MKTIKELQEFGFIKAGCWILLENQRIDFKIEHKFESIEDILYAFESDNIVKYIGITEQTLKGRMINYKSGHEENKSSGFTNKFVNANIKKLLIDDKKVNIYFFRGEADCSFRSLRISLSTGIEKSLINLFDLNNNLWNSRGVKIVNKKKKNIKIDKSSSETNIQENQSIIKLGQESYNKGFILFKNDVNSLLPKDSEGINLIYKEKVISGWFTRSFDNKKVNGYKELKSIFKNDFHLGEEILVTILNSNEIQIEKIANNAK